MKLSDLSYKVTSGLVEYSHWLPSAVALFNKEYSPTIGTISHSSCCMLPLEEDYLSYWSMSNKIVHYGRFFNFKNIECEIIEFWTGFSIERNKTNYIIWFDEKDPFNQYKKNLKKSFTNAKSENGEFWIPIKSTDIKNETVVKFWHSVLKELNK
jgi:hypothetical protein